MKRRPMIVLALTLALPAMAQQAAPRAAQPDAGRDPAVAASPELPLSEGRFNAAFQYHNEWLLMRDLIDAKREMSSRYDPQMMPEFTGLLEVNQEPIERLIEASRLERCDFGVANERGIDATMPYLRLMRASAQILIDDALRLESLGDMDGAVRRVRAVYRMADHTAASQNGFLIHTLLGVSMAEVANERVARLLEEHRLTQGHAAVLTKEIDRLLTDDPFHARAAIVSERDVMTVWVKSEFTDDQAGLRFARRYLDFGPVVDVKELQRLDGDELAAEVDRSRGAYDDLFAAWDADDPQAEMAKIGEQLEAGRYGPFAKAMIPSVSQMKASVIEAVANLKKLRSRLETVA